MLLLSLSAFPALSNSFFCLLSQDLRVGLLGTHCTSASFSASWHPSLFPRAIPTGCGIRVHSDPRRTWSGPRGFLLATAVSNSESAVRRLVCSTGRESFLSRPQISFQFDCDVFDVGFTGLILFILDFVNLWVYVFC